MEPTNNNQTEHSTPTNTPMEQKKGGISLPAAILTGAVIIAIALIVAFGGNKDAAPAAGTPAQPDEVTSVPKAVATIRANDRVRGDMATAEVAIIEYSDSDCPFCERFHTTLENIYDAYDGKVAWVYRYFPLASLHPNATTEAVAMECVAQLGGNSAFNKYLDEVIKITLTPDAKSNAQLTTLATAQGIDKALFATCITGTAASDRVAADTAEAQEIGARGTPFSIIVNLKSGEQKIVPGAYPLEDIKKEIDALL